jgi:HAMP domain-containing protein
VWWLILVLVVIAAFAVPRFGKAVLVGAAILVAIVCAFWISANVEEKRARTRIAAREVELEEITLSPSSGETYILAGRIHNHSARYTLTGLEMRFTARDCPDTADCEVVGQSEKSLYLSIPPGQTREVSDEYVFFSGLGAPRGTRKWNYDITSVSGAPQGR